jgi:glucosamine--fructose-6-phosphate aminotransferase (isomerizing)
MQADTEKYDPFNLCTDMLAAAGVVKGFDPAVAEPIADAVKQAGKLLLTGEGSSRLFPAKHAIKIARQRGYGLQLHTEAGCQSQGYDLIDWAVLAASNSGRTAEVVQLFKQLEAAGHDKRFSVAAFADSLLQQSANHGVVLGCGEEGAVAATKSVIEQALVVQSVIESAVNDKQLTGQLSAIGDAMHDAMTAQVPDEITKMLSQSKVIYWAGPNDGVAEELTLKTNEITRKPSDYLEGTYAAHGIEEVMDAGEVVIWIDPIEDQEAKFEEVLVKGVGIHIIAISSRDTRFPTIKVADCGDYAGYAHMAAGWNLLVETGIALNVDLDKPVRARKVGNAFVG